MVKVATKLFDDFSQSNSSMLYMQEYVVQFPGILDGITGMYTYMILINIHNINLPFFCFSFQ